MQTHAASVKVELERLGLDKVSLYTSASIEKELLVSYLGKFEKDSNNVIRLSYSTVTQNKGIQYNGTLTAEIFKIPVNLLVDAPDCTITLNVFSDFDQANMPELDLRDPAGIFKGNCFIN